MSTRPILLSLLTVTGLVLAIAEPVPAQNALGDGRALDANLNPLSRGLNPASTGDDFRSRNWIVTNNVVGGRGFRESVGYTASDAFRGETGADDLFDFRAGSEWSDVNLVNFGSTYQRFRFGQDAGLLGYERTNQGTSAAALDRIYPSQRLHSAQVQLDQVAFSTLSSNAQDKLVQPSVVGSYSDSEGNPMVIRASSLGGLEQTSMNQVGEIVGLTLYDFARLAEDIDEGRDAETEIGRTYKSSYAELLDGNRLTTEPGRNLLDPKRIGDVEESDDEAADEESPVDDGRVSGDKELRRIREAVAERFARMAASGVSGLGPELDAETVDELEEHLRALRLYLTGSAQEPGDPVDPDDATMRRRIGLDSGENRVPGSTLEELDPNRPLDQPVDQPAPDLQAAPPKLEDFGLILRHGERIDTLANEGDDARFNELLSSAEQALREGRFFWAERRFTRALRITPGHPLATTGLVHTQIGAGLYLSASLTLRSLYVYQPEMIDVRFAPELVPNRPRLLAALQTLGDRLQERRDRSNTALLYAYVGRLLEEPGTIERGLDVLAEDSPDDPLLPLLRSIWLTAPEK